MPGTSADTQLQPYIPRVTVEWLASAPEQRWRCIDGSLVFADISGFTALSERLARSGRVGAEELTDLIGTCFADLLAAAYEQQGSLLKFGGDALLLLFTDPGHARRACKAAADMRTSMRTAGQLRSSSGKVRLRMSAGVSSGPIHLFCVGGSHRELVIAGPTASAVVALEHDALAGEVVVGPAAAKALPSRALGERRGEGLLLRARTVAGRAEAIPPRPAPTVDLSMCIPRALRERLSQADLDPDHRSVGLAFLRFSGTDQLLQRHGADALAAAIEELVVAVQEAADAHDVSFLGSDVDLDGGKIILVSGAPLARDDDDGRLLRAVRQIADRSLRLTTRIGVNRGHVFAGEVGPSYRRTYTVMGDAVNLAARVMAAAQPGQILVTDAPLENSRTPFSVTAVPPFAVKGKSELVRAYALGKRHTGAGAERDHHDVELTGRDAELDQLRGLLDRARSGAGATVVVTGDPGIGKSRLVEELVRTQQPHVVAVRSEPYESSTPFYVAGRLLRSLLFEPGEPVVTESLHSKAAGLDVDLHDWMPLLADVLGVRVADTPVTSQLHSRYRRQRAIQVAADLAIARIGNLEAVLVVEDAQWLDDASAEFFTTLSARIGRTSSLLVMVRRDTPGAVALSGASTIRLSPVDDRAAMRLLQLASPAPLPPHRAISLVERASGNPLYLLEVARSGSASDDLPANIEAAVAARIDELPAGNRNVLRRAAVLGTSFEREVLEALLDDPAPPDLLSGLQPLLTPEAGGRLRFANPVVRDVAYASLPFNTRKQLHVRAARALERLPGVDPADNAGLLSLHYHYAGDREAVWKYARQAGDRAREKYANIEAVELLDRALASARQLAGLGRREVASTWEMLGDAADLAGMTDKAKHAYRTARRLARELPVRYAALCGKEAYMALRDGRSRAAVRWLNTGLAALEIDDASTPRGPSAPFGPLGPLVVLAVEVERTRARGRLLARLASIRSSQGLARKAIHLAWVAHTDALRSGDMQTVGTLYTIIDGAQIASGHPEAAVHTPEAIAIFERLGLFEELGVVLNNLGARAYYGGRWGEALKLYERGRDATLRAGNYVDAGYGTFNIAEILIDQGRLDEAGRLVAELADLWNSAGFSVGLTFVADLRGRIALRRGDPVAALHHLEDARAAYASSGMSVQTLVVDAWRAEALCRSNRAGDAGSLLAEALQRDRSLGGTGAAPALLRVRAWVEAAAGRIADAQATLDGALQAARARGARYDIAQALQAIAALGPRGGRPLGRTEAAELDGLVTELALSVALPPERAAPIPRGP